MVGGTNNPGRSLREYHNVVTLLQPIDGHLSKGRWKLAHSFLGHWPPPRGASVPIRHVSI